MKKILRLLIPIMLMLLLMLVGCELKNKDEVELSLNKLLEYKDSYVGDISAVGNILSELPLNESGNGVELKTDEKPYEITVNYNLKDDLKEEILEKNAIVLFALIKNVDTINFKIENLDNKVYKYNKDELIEKYEVDFKKISEDKESLQKFLYS
ncbi:DUF4825 domain-containing protein [Clostridium senegalense]|uniref:DUF4825 domain-containing protein n=1 Tax=Clostridium senegalense TaxID=1465809 RepID=UPI001C102EAD|nr:DUF4825 domain-containing protein [Clostridium senegalense]MBU5228396.1 DUF4825 domain-containing protein [Clostridium senegalense]